MGNMRFCLLASHEARAFILAKMHTHSDVGASLHWKEWPAIQKGSLGVRDFSVCGGIKCYCVLLLSTITTSICEPGSLVPLIHQLLISGSPSASLVIFFVLSLVVWRPQLLHHLPVHVNIAPLLVLALHALVCTISFFVQWSPLHVLSCG